MKPAIAWLLNGFDRRVAASAITAQPVDRAAFIATSEGPRKRCHTESGAVAFAGGFAKPAEASGVAGVFVNFHLTTVG